MHRCEKTGRDGELLGTEQRCGRPCQNHCQAYRRELADLRWTEVIGLANDGDEKVLAGLKEYTDGLAVQIYNLNIYLDLDIIAIGGGISQQPLLHKYLQRSLDEVLENIPLRKISPYVPEPKITNCRFYNDANLIGALYHFMNK